MLVEDEEAGAGAEDGEAGRRLESEQREQGRSPEVPKELNSLSSQKLLFLKKKSSVYIHIYTYT